MIILFVISTSSYPQLNTDVFKQNERLGKGGNFGNILYTWDNWNKDHDISDMDKMKEIGMTGILSLKFIITVRTGLHIRGLMAINQV